MRFSLFFLGLSLFAAEIPAGAELQVRLTRKVSSKDAKPGTPVETVVIAPFPAGGKTAIQPGVLLRGIVKAAKAYKDPANRAELAIEFGEMSEKDGQPVKLSAKVKDVENAREFLEEGGLIKGIDPSQTISARIDQGVEKLGGAFGDFLGSIKAAVLKPPDPEITYEPGTDMVVVVATPFLWEGKADGPKAGAISDAGALARLVNAQPFRTVAQDPPNPSDMTNLMFIAEAEELKTAFAAAGWTEAVVLAKMSKFETFKALAEARGYKEAPMSILLLDGRKPDMDFEKMLNTFAMRHHLRIWRRPDTFEGKPAWVCAATHDIGIELSPEQRTFIHKIDSNIDSERAKVMNDLIFTGKVKAAAFVERANIPKDAANATGDKLITDGRMAVLQF